MNSTINFGIDLGTTNSAIAMYDAGEINVFKNPRTLKQTIPSVVAFKGDRIIIGEKAAELLQKDNADVFGGFKRRMGSMDRYPLTGSAKTVSPIELSAIVLKELRTFVQSDTPPPAVVITIPAAFDTNQSNATKQAGYDAGFKEVILLQEPIAASLAYANRKNAPIEEGQWIVFDFGGGTFDVALTGIVDDEMKVLDHEGDNFLGGKDIDRAIVEKFIVPELEKAGTFAALLENMRNTDGAYHRLYNKLIYLAEEAKITLSSISQVDIEFDVEDETGKSLDMVIPFFQHKLEEIAQPFIDKAIALVDMLLKRNRMERNEINNILLVGGTTYLPAVRKALTESFSIPVNTSIDPITAVVIGAAYFAGLQVRKEVKEQKQSLRQSGESKFQIQTAYERIVRTEDTALLYKTSGEINNLTLRITRGDSGFDSGNIFLSKGGVIQLPLLPGVFNDFLLQVNDSHGTKVYEEIIGITHGKFGIQGQPLPHPIGIEVDDPGTNSTYLEILFQKNSILPLRRTIVKKVAESIKVGSANTIEIHVYEGDIDSIPQANKHIGSIIISGSDLLRDLIRGSDIELTIEISESRDVKVAAYLVLTDQHFENTFSPSEIQFNGQSILQNLDLFKKNLLHRREQSERKGKYEEAGQIQKILEEIDQLRPQIRALSDNDTTDEKYVLDGRAREIGKRIHELFSNSFLTKIIEDYFRVKEYFVQKMLQQEILPEEIKSFEDIVSRERTFLQEGNITVIKQKIAQLDMLLRRSNAQRKYSNEELQLIYIHFKGLDYQNKSKAADLVNKGEKAMGQGDFISLYSVIAELAQLHNAESNADNYFANRKTGLE